MNQMVLMLFLVVAICSACSPCQGDNCWTFRAAFSSGSSGPPLQHVMISVSVLTGRYTISSTTSMVNVDYNGTSRWAAVSYAIPPICASVYGPITVILDYNDTVIYVNGTVNMYCSIGPQNTFSVVVSVPFVIDHHLSFGWFCADLQSVGMIPGGPNAPTVTDSASPTAVTPTNTPSPSPFNWTMYIAIVVAAAIGLSLLAMGAAITYYRLCQMRSNEDTQAISQ